MFIDLTCVSDKNLRTQLAVRLTSNKVQGPRSAGREQVVLVCVMHLSAPKLSIIPRVYECMNLPLYQQVLPGGHQKTSKRWGVSCALVRRRLVEHGTVNGGSFA